MPPAVYFHPRFLEHETGAHPESAERVVVVRSFLREHAPSLEWLTPTPAPVEAITRVHDSAYVASVRRLAESGGGGIDLETIVSADSWEAALLAAGAGLDALRRAQAGGGPAFLLVRPPGHHAVPGRGMGFCLFNNIAVAASFLLAERGLDRVLIFDWDVHHGNGTQDAFYRDPRVLFVSMHLSPHYPGTGAAAEVGSGPGAGFTANVPLPRGAGDGAVSLVFSSLVEPLARAFRPQAVLVSSGFDSQAGDPLGGLTFSPGAFQFMAGRLAELTAELDALPPVFFLEGGYVPQLMAGSVLRTLDGLREGPTEITVGPRPEERAAVERTLKHLAPFWGGVLSA